MLLEPVRAVSLECLRQHIDPHVEGIGCREHDPDLASHSAGGAGRAELELGAARGLERADLELAHLCELDQGLQELGMRHAGKL